MENIKVMTEGEHLVHCIESTMRIPTGNRRCGIKDGAPMKLIPAHRKFIIDVMDSKDEIGLRKIREALLCVPRKNAKTSLLAAWALAVLIFGKRTNIDIYCIASCLSQSRLLFKFAVKIFNCSPILRSIKGLVVLTDSFEYRPKFNKFQCKPASPNSLQGLNSPLILCDELHVWEDQELYNVLVSSQQAQDEGLLISITTAGARRSGICWDLVQYAKSQKSETDPLKFNPSFYSMIYGIEEGDDWEDEKVWAKCNPGWGITIAPDMFRADYIKAKGMPSTAASFRRYYLNEWAGDGTTQLISDDSWMKVVNANIKMQDFKDCPCYIAIDISARNDITAIIVVFKKDNELYMFEFYFLPFGNIDHLTDQHDKPYRQWIDEGYLLTTNGDIIDHGYVAEFIVNTFQEYNVERISIDAQFAASTLYLRLLDAGYGCGKEDDIVKLENTGTWKDSEHTKKLERLVLNQKLWHTGHPITRWMCQNAHYETGMKGDIRLCKMKKNNKYKIDGMTALVQTMKHINLVDRKDISFTTEDYMKLFG